MAKSAKKSLVTIMENPQPKKSVTRYDCADDDKALGNVYVDKKLLESIGSPDKIKVTIEAA